MEIFSDDEEDYLIYNNYILQKKRNSDIIQKKLIKVLDQELRIIKIWI